MSLSDLSLVTQSLRTLLDLNVRRMMSGLAPGEFAVSLLPPEQVGAATNAINLYLYHVVEDVQSRNGPGPARGAPDAARAPLALRLFYVVTAHHTDTLVQQRLMSFALMTMHDYPVLNDAVSIDAGAGPEPVFAAALRGRGNSFQILLRPQTPEDTVAFWSAAGRQTVRLSAWYEVRTARLAIEGIPGIPGTPSP